MTTLEDLKNTRCGRVPASRFIRYPIGYARAIRHAYLLTLCLCVSLASLGCTWAAHLEKSKEGWSWTWYTSPPLFDKKVGKLEATNNAGSGIVLENYSSDEKLTAVSVELLKAYLGANLAMLTPATRPVNPRRRSQSPIP
jgi:hypothetical protein